jgi:hypothetical protein
VFVLYGLFIDNLYNVSLISVFDRFEDAPKRKSETAHRWIDNAMAKRKLQIEQHQLSEIKG